MTALETYVKDKKRQDYIKQVRKKIDKLGIEYIYYQFISVTGRIVGKGVPADHWESIANKGFQLVYGATANLFTNRHGDYIGYGPEAHELVGIPDPETFVQIPWDKRIARVFCTCFRNREEESDPGGFLTTNAGPTVSDSEVERVVAIAKEIVNSNAQAERDRALETAHEIVSIAEDIAASRAVERLTGRSRAEADEPADEKRKKATVLAKMMELL